MKNSGRAWVILLALVFVATLARATWAREVGWTRLYGLKVGTKRDNFGKFVVNPRTGAVTHTGTPTDGIKISGACTDAIEISGGCTNAINISASQSAGVYYVANQLVSEGAWVHGVKVELTRTANQTIASGGWYGAQFVLNAGSSGWSAASPKVHALAAVLKGSDCVNNSDTNVARFETQSAAKTGALCYLLANTGTTVGTSLYIASHVNVTEAININQQSSSTLAKGIRLMAGAGSAITTGISVETDSTDGIKITGDCTDAIEISGANTYGVKISGSQTGGLYYEANQSVQEGAWVHGVKVELTRTANVQVATGAWFGAQFVLNQGSSSYATPTGKVHALAAIIKGSDGRTDSDGNVARFETQSDGKVGNILYLLANTGSTIGDSLMYAVSHVNVNKGIEINVQSSSTMGSGIRMLDGAGSSITTAIEIDSSSTTGIDMSGATISGQDLKLSSGAIIKTGTGSPDGNVTAAKGSLYIQTDGSVDAQLWVNEDGSTAWGYVDTT